MKRAGIAGAGLIGRLLAWQLLQQGWQVSLFDRDQPDGANSAGLTAAGLLSPLAEIDTAEPWLVQMGLMALQRWPELLRQLTMPVFFQQQGSVMVAHAADQSELQRFINLVQRHLPNGDWLRPLTTAELDDKVPGLAYFSQGYYLPQEGQISGPDLYAALANEFRVAKVAWHSATEVMSLAPGQITTATDHYDFDWVFDCRGVGAKHDVPNLRGVRGEVLWLHAPAVRLTQPLRLMHPRYRLYLVPCPDNLIIIGASEIESEDRQPITVRSCLELLTAAYSVHAGFAEARVIKSLVNCRPAFADNMPRIIYTEGLMRINGLYRHGYCLAPVVIDSALQLLNGEQAALPFPQLVIAKSD